MCDLVDNTMTGALKVMSVERGLDPRDFTLSAFGGAGPVHGARLMGLLGAPRLLVPRYPGILCAIGLLATDLRYDYAVTRLQRAGAYDPRSGRPLPNWPAGRMIACRGMEPRRRTANSPMRRTCAMKNRASS
jgi:hypothetical protein